MYISHVSNKTILYYLMNSEEYYCDFTIDKNYILAYKVYSKKIYKLYFNNWKHIYQSKMHLIQNN